MTESLKKSLLVIEPDENFHTLYKQELPEKTQMVLLLARDGVMAYQMARNQKIDIIVTEWKVPKISGVKLIEAVREMPQNNNAQLVILTENLEEPKTQTRGSRDISYMQKPCDLNILAKKIVDLSKLDVEKKRFKLDVDFINPFIDMSMKTLNGLCNMDQITAMRPYILSENELLDIDISGVLNIVSPYFSGLIGISFNNEVYKKIIARMISEKDVNEINIDNQDGAAEIINIIFGNTKAVLNERGYKLERAMPSVMRGRKHKVAQAQKTPVLVVPFETNLGSFFVQICVKAI